MRHYTQDINDISSLYFSLKQEKEKQTIISEQKKLSILGEKGATKSVRKFKYNKVVIYSRSGDELPRAVYKAKVIDYDKQPGVQNITAVDNDKQKRLIIKVDKNNVFNVTILDKNHNIADEFIVRSLAMKDPFEPDKLSIIKAEQ
jgi:hypothetical protein